LFKSVGWLLTQSLLASKLRTFWKIIALEMTAQRLKRAKKKPTKAKAPRPF